MKTNVSNMPINTLYKFDDNRYVIKLMLKETRDGNYPSNEASEFTEVYEKNTDGYMYRKVSGILVDNPDVFDFNKQFAIYDPDNDMQITFEVKEFNEHVEELSEVRQAIEREYNRSHGK